MAIVRHEVLIDGVVNQSVDMPALIADVTGLPATNPGATVSVQIRGIDDGGSVGFLSDPVAVTLLDAADPLDPPATPTLNPVDPETVTADGADLSWSAVADAATYELQIDAGSGFVTVQDTAATTYDARDLASDQLHRAQLRARNAAGDSAYSAVVEWTTQATGGGPDPNPPGNLTAGNSDRLTTTAGDALITGA